jgi:NAD(P)-dependent dehydrogenase (short-subunit alcohol dehydrogenase family)
MADGKLNGRIALVAGATRGAGRGIACALGEQGATVYCTGRSVRGAIATAGRVETIEETAEMVTARGGEGIAIRVDHSVPEEVRSLCARIKQERGGLDLLVNDIWGGDELCEWKPFWESSLANGLTMLDRGLRTHIITAHTAAPLLFGRSRPLIVEITDGDFFSYRGNVIYDLVKTSVIRFAYALSVELKKQSVNAVAVTPGFLRSEAMLDHFGVTEANWRDGVKQDPHFIASETPLFVGRAIAALACDPAISKRNGRVLSSWALGREYGFVDADGSRPDWGAYYEKTLGKLASCDDVFYEYWKPIFP